MAKITVDFERCKGCLLCIRTCPKKCISQGSAINAKGYAAVEQTDPANCTGCMLCAMVCPDVALTVYR